MNNYNLIYKTYKHGGSLKEFSTEDIFNSLKKNKLQVVLVYYTDKTEHIYNFVQETKKFYKII